MNKIRTIITLAFVMAASVFVSCEKVEADPVVYLEVNANNIWWWVMKIKIPRVNSNYKW